MSEPNRVIKLILLGDPECGKTSLLLRYCQNTFSAESEVTIDESFERKTITTPDGEREVQVWDTAGEERFRNLTSSTYRGANGIFLVYDVSNKESFDNLENWIGDVRIQRGAVGEEVATVIVGNKIDIKDDQRVVPQDEAEAFAARHRLPYFETSAKTGDNVNTAFQALLDLIIPAPAPVIVATTLPVPTPPVPPPEPTSSKCCIIV